MIEITRKKHRPREKEKEKKMVGAQKSKENTEKIGNIYGSVRKVRV